MESTCEQHVPEHGQSSTGREFCPEVDGSVPLKCLFLIKSQRMEVVLPDLKALLSKSHHSNLLNMEGPKIHHTSPSLSLEALGTGRDSSLHAQKCPSLHRLGVLFSNPESRWSSTSIPSGAWFSMWAKMCWQDLALYARKCQLWFLVCGGSIQLTCDLLQVWGGLWDMLGSGWATSRAGQEEFPGSQLLEEHPRRHLPLQLSCCWKECNLLGYYIKEGVGPLLWPPLKRQST